MDAVKPYNKLVIELDNRNANIGSAYIMSHGPTGRIEG